MIFARVAVAALGIALLCACGREKPEPAPAAVPGPGGAGSLAALLPASGSPAGWSRVKEPQVFGADDLWEYIDGAADAYLTYGVQKVATAGYRHTSGLEATIDIYRSSDPLGAFGIYAQESNPAADFVQIGAEGYISSNVLNFYSGRDYVKITASRAGADVGSELRSLSTHLGGGLAATGSPPADIRAFPPSALVAHSIRYVPKDLLGQSYLATALEAQYQERDAVSKLSVARFDGADAAAVALDRFRGFLASQSAVQPLARSPGDGGLKGTHKFYGPVVALRAGNLLAFALGVPDESTALARLTDVIRRANGPTQQADGGRR